MTPFFRWLLFAFACVLLGVVIAILCIFLNDSASNRIKSNVAGIANSEIATESQPSKSNVSEQSVLPIPKYKVPIFIQEPPWNGYDGYHFMQSSSLAMSSDGNTLAIGASAARCVYIQSKHADGNWVHETVLIGEAGSGPWTGGIPDTRFGHAVSLSANGNTLACGAFNMSKVWIYTRADSLWTTQAELSGPAGSGYGVSTALSYDGNTLAIGSNNIYQPGIQPHVYIFTRNGVEWTLQQILDPTNSIGYSNFGYSIGLSGDGYTVVIGGYTDSNQKGAIWISQQTSKTWSTPLKLAVDISPSTNQGRRVAISGDGSTIAFTEINHDLSLYGQDFTKKWMATGRTYVYIHTGPNEWRLSSNLTPYVASAGASVCLNHSGDRLFIGDTFTGCVYIYSRTGKNYYEMVSTITFEHPTTDQRTFGYTVAVDSWGETLVVGAPFELGPENVFGNGYGPPLVGATFVYET